MNTDFSVLDSTLSRIKESLRVLEDVSRYVLKHDYATHQYEHIRSVVSSLEQRIGVALLIGSRKQQGTDVSVVSFTNISPQKTVFSVIRYHAAQVTESFRVIESFVRAYHTSIAADVEQLRYQLYGLERIVLEQTPHYVLSLYTSTGCISPVSSDVDELIRCVEGGAKMITLRDDAGSFHHVYAKAKQLHQYLKEQRLSLGNTEPVLFFLDTHVDVAVKIPVDGICIREKGMHSLQDVRWKVGSHMIVGWYGTTIESLSQGVEAGADIVYYGPIFSQEQVSIAKEQLSDIQERMDIPLVVYGGITRESVKDIYHYGIKNMQVDTAVSLFFS